MTLTAAQLCRWWRQRERGCADVMPLGEAEKRQEQMRASCICIRCICHHPNRSQHSRHHCAGQSCDGRKMRGKYCGEDGTCIGEVCAHFSTSLLIYRPVTPRPPIASSREKKRLGRCRYVCRESKVPHILEILFFNTLSSTIYQLTGLRVPHSVSPKKFASPTQPTLGCNLCLETAP